MEMDSQKNIFGIMLTISGTFSVIASNTVMFYTNALVLWIFLVFGIILIIVALRFMETLVRGEHYFFREFY